MAHIYYVCMRACLCVYDMFYMFYMFLHPPPSPLPPSLIVSFQMNGEEGDSDDEAPKSSKVSKTGPRSSIGMTNSLAYAEMDVFPDEEQQYKDSMAEFAHLKELQKMVRTMPCVRVYCSECACTVCVVTCHLSRVPHDDAY